MSRAQKLIDLVEKKNLSKLSDDELTAEASKFFKKMQSVKSLKKLVAMDKEWKEFVKEAEKRGFGK